MLAHSLGRAALPIPSARKRMRIFGSLNNMCEMLRCSFGIMEISKRDPTGCEVCIHPIEAFHGRGSIACDAISCMSIAIIQQFTHKQPALKPPLIKVYESLGVFRRGKY